MQGISNKPLDEDRCIDATLRIIQEAGMENRVEYISFSKHACDYLVSLGKGAFKVSYLNGDMTPLEAKQAGYTGIDFVTTNEPEKAKSL